MSARPIPIDDLRRDGGTQVREHVREDIIVAYSEALAGGAELPAPVVFSDGTSYWLADGFHRVEARRRAGETEIACDVRSGTQRDALLFACGANADHGLRRSNADKRRAVETMLADPEWASWSDRKIAETCNVSHPFVARMRRESEPECGNVTTAARVTVVPPWVVQEPTPGMLAMLASLSDDEILRDFVTPDGDGAIGITVDALNHQVAYFAERGTWDRRQLAIDLTAEHARTRAYRLEAMRRGLRECRGWPTTEVAVCRLLQAGCTEDDINLATLYVLANPDGTAAVAKRGDA